VVIARFQFLVSSPDLVDDFLPCPIHLERAEVQSDISRPGRHTSDDGVLAMANSYAFRALKEVL
jgi:hypothetical protein